MKEREQLGQETEDNIEKYKEMLGDAKAVFILSLDIKKKGKGEIEEFKSTSYADLDIHGFLGGGHANVIAAAEIGAHFPNVILVTTSHHQPEYPTHAEIYASELERLGIPKQQIKMEIASKSTLTELVEMFKMAKSNNWENVAILTAEYHKERVQEMLSHIGELANIFKLTDKDFTEAFEFFEQGKKLQVNFLDPETILPMRDPRYAKIVETVRNSQVYQKRVEAEKKGVQQIREGNYGLKK